MQSTCYSCHNIMKLENSRQIFKKILKYQFSGKPSNGSRVVPCDGRTDTHTHMTTLVVAFRNFYNAPTNVSALTATFCVSYGLLRPLEFNLIKPSGKCMYH